MSDATDVRPWWRLRDTPVPGGVPDLAKALLWTELAIVLFVSLGRSAVYSVVNLLSALTAPGPLSSQAANLKPAQMLETRDGDTRRISRPLAWGLMALSMAPLLVVGSLAAPFAGHVAQLASVRIALVALNSIVMAHYFADAFLYRLRLPEVRKVVLRRLGF